MDIAFEHEIRQRAYEIWAASGMNEGEAEAHWLHAERTVRIEVEAAATAAAKGKAKPAKAAAGASKTMVATDTVTKVAKPKVAKTKVAASKATATKTNAAPRRPKAGSVEAIA